MQMTAAQRTTAMAFTIALVAAAPAFARPPTLQNWSGYDQRLKESREAQAPTATPPADAKRRVHHKRKAAGPT
jgi:hypothetical protein